MIGPLTVAPMPADDTAHRTEPMATLPMFHNLRESRIQMEYDVA